MNKEEVLADMSFQIHFGKVEELAAKVILSQDASLEKNLSNLQWQSDKRGISFKEFQRFDRIILCGTSRHPLEQAIESPITIEPNDCNTRYQRHLFLGGTIASMQSVSYRYDEYDQKYSSSGNIWLTTANYRWHLCSQDSEFEFGKEAKKRMTSTVIDLFLEKCYSLDFVESYIIYESARERELASDYLYEKFKKNKGDRRFDIAIENA